MTEPVLLNRYDENDHAREVIFPPVGVVLVWSMESLSWIPVLCQANTAGEMNLWSIHGNKSLSHMLYHGWYTHWLPIEIPTDPPLKPPGHRGSHGGFRDLDGFESHGHDYGGPPDA